MAPLRSTLVAWVALVVALAAVVWWMPGHDNPYGASGDSSGAPISTSGLTPGAPSPTPVPNDPSDSASPDEPQGPSGLSAGCRKGSVLLESGNPDYVELAERAFQDAAGTTPECAAAGLEEIAAVRAAAKTQAADALGTTAQQLTEKAHRQLDEGESAAAAKTVEQLEAAGATTPPELRDGGTRLGWWQRFLNSVTPTGRTAGELLLLALGVLLLAALLVRGVLAAKRAVSDGLRPPLRIAPPAGEDGDALANVLADHLKRLGSNQVSRNARVASPEDAAFKLPDDIGEAFAPAGLITSLVSHALGLLPTRHRQVSITALPVDPFDGLGVRVTLKTPDGASDHITLRERTYGLAAEDDDAASTRLQSLMLPAAIWLAFHPLLGKLDVPPLGTEDWRSYAQFSVGAAAARRGDREAAEGHYLRALDLDGSNCGARTNLAALLLSPRGIEARVPAAARGRLELDRLDLALALLEPFAPGGADDAAQASPSATECKARYLRFLVLLYRRRPGDRDEVIEGMPAFREALASIPAGHELAGVCEHMLGLTEPLVDSAQASVDRDVTGESPWPPEWLRTDVLYNHACAAGRRHAAPATAPTDRPAARDDALRLLQLALARVEAQGRRYAATDPALTSLHRDAVFQALVAGPPTTAS